VYSHEPAGYECPFCAVVAGADNPPWVLQRDIVYRDEETTAWVNGRWWPNNPGAVILVPNQHIENIYVLERDLAGAVHETVRRVALAMKSAFGCDGTSTRQHNEPAGYQEVWHYHLHVFPRHLGDDLYGSEPRMSTPDERAPYVEGLREALGAPLASGGHAPDWR
jgi:histidine triad (HIT) family protein